VVAADRRGDRANSREHCEGSEHAEREPSSHSVLPSLFWAAGGANWRISRYRGADSAANYADVKANEKISVSLGSVEATPLGRPISQQPPKLLAQIPHRGPTDVLATVAFAGIHVLPCRRVDLPDVAATETFDRERAHEHI